MRKIIYFFLFIGILFTNACGRNDEGDSEFLALMRLHEHAHFIRENEPIGASGTVVKADYMGTILITEDAVLLVTVMNAAFYDADSLTAIEEMREMDIIVEEAEFSHNTLVDAIERMGEYNRVNDAGAVWWFISPVERDRIMVILEPYTPAQVSLFHAFLLENDIDPVMFHFEPLFSEEMQQERNERITRAAAFPRDMIVTCEFTDIEVSRTGLAFALINRTDYVFRNSGYGWLLAHYVAGEWLPVPSLPGRDTINWFFWGWDIQPDGIWHERIDFSPLFGELPVGRYMLILSGELTRRGLHSTRDGVTTIIEPLIKEGHAVVTFSITENTPLVLRD